jgi:hypothetical protein
MVCLKRKEQSEGLGGWEDNNKTNLRKIGLEDVEWFHLAHDGDRWRALVNTVMNIQVP